MNAATICSGADLFLAAGIAEFLLPLVYAGHVSQITWIKSPWAQQVRPVTVAGHGALGLSTVLDRQQRQPRPPHWHQEGLEYVSHPSPAVSVFH